MDLFNDLDIEHLDVENLENLYEELLTLNISELIHFLKEIILNEIPKEIIELVITVI